MKRLLQMCMFVCLIGLLAACGSANEAQEGANTVENSEVAENNSSSNDDGAADEDHATPEEESNDPAETEEAPEQNKDDEAVDTVTAEGTFIGLADSHTIEVETEDETIALQILDFPDDDWGSIEMGTPITIEYYENENGQLILTDYTLE